MKQILKSSSAIPHSLTRAQHQYLAGFFDGEGSIGLYYNKGKKHWAPRLSITQNVSKHVTRLFNLWATAFGGHVYSGRSGQELQLDFKSREAVLAFITVIGPYCIGKRMQLIVLEQWMHTKTYSFRTSQTLKALKRIEHV